MSKPFAHCVQRGTLLLLTAATLALAGCGNKNAAPPAPPPAEVYVLKTATEPITLFEEYVGQTEAVDTVEIRARVSGILEKQAFEDGSRVKQGQLLFVIDPQPFNAALAQAKATLAQAVATHTNSKQNLERIRPLLADKAISQQDLDTAIAKEATDAANVEAARAQVKTAQLNLEYTTIMAPREGLISKALIKPGGLVNASTTLLTTMYSVDPMYVNFAISEQKLLEAQRTLKRTADEKWRLPPFRLRLADGTEYSSNGTLNFVDTAVDPKTGTVQVRVQVPNHDRFLRAGQLVRVIFPSLKPLEAIRVPQQAVTELQGKRSVFVVDAESKAQFREINATERIGNDWVVQGGLQPGELIIVEGTQKVRPGAPVKTIAVTRDDKGNIVKPAAPPGEAQKGAAAKDAKGETKGAEPKSAPAPDKGKK